jgi:hypothetical protein
MFESRTARLQKDVQHMTVHRTRNGSPTRCKTVEATRQTKETGTGGGAWATDAGRFAVLPLRSKELTELPLPRC